MAGIAVGIGAKAAKVADLSAQAFATGVGAVAEADAAHVAEALEAAYSPNVYPALLPQRTDTLLYQKYPNILSWIYCVSLHITDGGRVI